MRPFWIAAFGAALMAVLAPTYAHHSGAMFDKTRTTKVSGTVREFVWTNPHASFKLDVDTGGKLETWAIEMNSPNNLVREGWKRSTIREGDKVTVVLNPLRDGKPGGWYVGITLPDGKYLGPPDGPKSSS